MKIIHMFFRVNNYSYLETKILWINSGVPHTVTYLLASILVNTIDHLFFHYFQIYLLNYYEPGIVLDAWDIYDVVSSDQ